MAPGEARVVFPSDLQAGSLAAGEFVLAGRLLGRDATAAWIGDAFASVQVQGTLSAVLGSLVKLRVRRGAEGLVLCAVSDVQSPAGPSSAEQSRLIGQRVGVNLRARASAMGSVRAFFATERFIEVDTPVVVPSPGLDLHLDAETTGSGYLTTSPEYQMKRLLVGGMPRIFQLAHVYRAGEVGALHNPEFAMLEWYRAFADVDEVMRDTEALVMAVAVELGAPFELEAPFVRLPVAEAFARFAGIGESDALALAERSPDEFFRALVERVEPRLAELDHPVFLVDYPVSQASLARAKPSDPRVCERFELYLSGVELCNGFGELTDPDEQRRRLVRDQSERARLGKPVYPIDERFLAALGEGMPPSAGNALGVDRLVALCLREPSIARVMSFPASIL